MKHYLLVYNRRQSRIVKWQEFDNRVEAPRGRLGAERDFRGMPDIEVVVLGGRSWESLGRTHARYFKSVQELAATAL